MGTRLSVRRGSHPGAVPPVGGEYHGSEVGPRHEPGRRENRRQGCPLPRGPHLSGTPTAPPAPVSGREYGRTQRACQLPRGDTDRGGSGRSKDNVAILGKTRQRLRPLHILACTYSRKTGGSHTSTVLPVLRHPHLDTIADIPGLCVAAERLFNRLPARRGTGRSPAGARGGRPCPILGCPAAPRGHAGARASGP